MSLTRRGGSGRPWCTGASEVGELWVDGDAEAAFLDRFALLISQHVLIGWDTRGEREATRSGRLVR